MTIATASLHFCTRDGTLKQGALTSDIVVINHRHGWMNDLPQIQLIYSSARLWRYQPHFRDCVCLYTTPALSFPVKLHQIQWRRLLREKCNRVTLCIIPLCVCVWVCVCYWTWANRFDEKSGYYVIVGTRSTTKRALTTPINPPPAMAPLATLKNKWKRLLCELCCNHTHEDRMTNP